jgi:hypothetical protein
VNNSAANDTPGPTWLPSNKNGTSNVRETVRYHRLTIGYVGGDSFRSNDAPYCDILAVSKNLNGRTGDFIRPRSAIGSAGGDIGNTVLDNGLRGEIDPSTGVARTVDGWQIGGKAIFATIGNPLLAPAADGGYGWSGLTPAEITAENALRAQFPVAANMDNNSSAEFLNNITRSINAFNANPSNDLFLVTTARSGFTNAGTVTALTTQGIGAKLTPANFAANYAAQFTFGTRTFVAINDAIAGFNATTDALIEVTSLTGTLNLNHFVTI